MGREVRMVPANWQHPKYTEGSAPYPRAVGHYIPMNEGGYTHAAAEWDEGHAKWGDGLVQSYGNGEEWVPKTDEHVGRYTEYAGPRPSPDDYMPDWPEAERTHLMMYEDTSEGTPISPAFATPEELARWLVDNDASAFADQTATYEQWLAMINRGWAPSAVIQGGVMTSGVASA